MFIFAVLVQENNSLGDNALYMKLAYTAGSNKKRKQLFASDEGDNILK